MDHGDSGVVNEGQEAIVQHQEQSSKQDLTNNSHVHEQDDADESEEILLEFEGNFDLRNIDNQVLKFVGLDTDEPVLQIGQTLYRAKLDTVIGTNLIFEQPTTGDTKLDYRSKSNKKILMKRVFLK